MSALLFGIIKEEDSKMPILLIYMCNQSPKNQLHPCS